MQGRSLQFLTPQANAAVANKIADPVKVEVKDKSKA
jgi:hypothetical protein